MVSNPTADKVFDELSDGGAFIRKAVAQATTYFEWREDQPAGTSREFWVDYDPGSADVNLKREEEEKQRLLKDDLKRVHMNGEEKAIEFGDFALKFSRQSRGKIWFLRLIDRDILKPLMKWVRVETDEKGYFSGRWKSENPIRRVPMRVSW
jgi:hypothetical protein